MRDGRRTPIELLMRKLALEEYDSPAPFEPRKLQPKQLVLPLKQAAGAPNQPLVKPGDRVAAGQPMGSVPEGQLGAIIHAPCAAEVVTVNGSIVLKPIV
jgi:Na+-translocating ferredoxin:NAD+ oxidoreductase RnfC subunit